MCIIYFYAGLSTIVGVKIILSTLEFQAVLIKDCTGFGMQVLYFFWHMYIGSIFEIHVI